MLTIVRLTHSHTHIHTHILTLVWLNRKIVGQQFSFNAVFIQLVLTEIVFVWLGGVVREVGMLLLKRGWEGRREQYTCRLTD